MSRRPMGVAVKADTWNAEDEARKVLAPWHIDRCYHEVKPCDCPPWQFDRNPMLIGMISVGSYPQFIDLAALESYVNSRGEWYDRPDCVDFDLVVRADIERVADACEHVLVLMEIHYV